MNEQNVLACFFVTLENDKFTVNRGADISHGTSIENLPHSLSAGYL